MNRNRSRPGLINRFFNKILAAVSPTQYYSDNANQTVFYDDDAGQDPYNTAGGQATISMAQLTANRVYQRATKTDGGQSKGQGAVTVSVTLSSTSPVYARCRSADDGTTILQQPFLGNSAGSTGDVVISGVDARLGWFYIDVATSASGPWTLGTSRVGMGRVNLITGQSLAVRGLAKIETQAATNASLGITPSPNSVVYATYTDGSTVVSTPTWTVPGDGTIYNSSGCAEYLRLQVAASGVNCALAGHAVGGTKISVYCPGGNQSASLRAILTAVGGFENVIWFQGHSDSQAGTAKVTYKIYLDQLFADLTAYNTVLGSNYGRVLASIPNMDSTIWGPPANVNIIRNAQAEWCQPNNGVYVQPEDLDLIDGVHETMAGAQVLAWHFHRATRAQFGLPNSDAGPVMGTATRAAGSAVINIPVTLSPGATTLVLVGSPASRCAVYPANTLTGALAVNSLALTSPTNIAVTLSAVPADGQAVDFWFCLTPDYTYTGQNDMIYDNATDGDGIPNGRQLTASLVQTFVQAPNHVPAGLGSNLTETSTTYGAGEMYFGQRMTGGYGLTQSVSDNMPSAPIWTIEGRVTHPTTAPSTLRVALGQGGKAYIGINPAGLVFATFNTATKGAQTITGKSLLDGLVHHVALDADGSSTYLFCDGVLQGMYASSAPITGNGSIPFSINSYGSTPATYQWLGTVEEVAIWNTCRYTDSYVVPSKPYTGAEIGLINLWHLDGNGSAAIY